MVAWRIAMRSAHLANYDVPHDCYQIIRPSFIRIPALMISTERNLRVDTCANTLPDNAARNCNHFSIVNGQLRRLFFFFLSTLVNRFLKNVHWIFMSIVFLPVRENLNLYEFLFSVFYSFSFSGFFFRTSVRFIRHLDWNEYFLTFL